MKVCFVCTGNYYRSRFAEAVFNFLSKECGESHIAKSRGLNISAADKTAREYGELSPYTKNKMDDLEIPRNLTSKKRKSISKKDLDEFDIIVIMDRSEHFKMVKEFIGEDKDMIEAAKNFKYWAIKDVSDWEPEETLGAILANVNKFFNEVRWGLL